MTSDVYVHEVRDSEFFDENWFLVVGTTMLVCGILYWLSLRAVRHSHLFASLTGDQQVDTASRIVASAHAVVSSACAVYLAWVDEGARPGPMFSNPHAAVFGRGPEPLRELCLCVTAGYLAYDLALCLRHHRVLGAPSMYVHHVVVGAGCLLCGKVGVGTLHVSLLLANEISTPFLNLRFVLLHLGRADSPAYALNGVAFAVSFFLCRICLLVFILAQIAASWIALAPQMWPTGSVSHRVSTLALTALLLAHTVVNVVWFRRILANVAHRLRALQQKPKQA